MAILQASTDTPANVVSMSTSTHHVYARVGGEFADQLAEHFVDAVRALVSGERTSLVVKMSDVTYTDSTGLNALVAARSLTRRMDGDVTLCDVPHRVLRLLDITHLTPAFTIRPIG